MPSAPTKQNYLVLTEERIQSMSACPLMWSCCELGSIVVSADSLGIGEAVENVVDKYTNVERREQNHILAPFL